MISAKRYGQWYELTLPPDWEGFTINYIISNIWRVPKKQIHLLKMEKGVKVNGEIIDWNTSLKGKDKLQLKIFTDDDYGVIPTYHDVEILYEDDHLIVFNKPAQMDTHPNEEGQSNTLLNAAAFHMQSQGEFRKIRHVHRLDRDTTGAVLFAKHPLAGSMLDRMLEERIIKRTYVALVQGTIKAKKGIINEPIGRDRHHATRRRVSPGGQPATTYFKVIRTFPKQDLSLITCQLETGRTHQIRVHLSYTGHPLAGDLLYGGRPLFKRQALHAAKLEFPHPFTMEKISCYAKVTDDQQLAKFLNVSPDELNKNNEAASK